MLLLLSCWWCYAVEGVRKLLRFFLVVFDRLEMVLDVFRVALVEYQDVCVHLFGHSHFLERLLDFVHFAFIENEHVLVALLCLAAFHAAIGSKAKIVIISESHIILNKFF